MKYPKERHTLLQLYPHTRQSYHTQFITYIIKYLTKCILSYLINYILKENLMRGIGLAGRHVAVIGFNFHKSGYSLGFKISQFSITWL